MTQNKDTQEDDAVGAWVIAMVFVTIAVLSFFFYVMFDGGNVQPAPMIGR